jgi:hypothetical protein
MKSLSVLFVILALMVGVSFADSSPTASINAPTLTDQFLAGDLVEVAITLEQAKEADLLQSDLLWKSQFQGGGGGGGGD